MESLVRGGPGVDAFESVAGLTADTGIGITAGVLPRQIHAGRVVHPSINVRRREKAPTNFDSIHARPLFSEHNTSSLAAAFIPSPA
jgi:hypothetical protein